MPSEAEIDPASSAVSNEQVLELLHELLRRSHMTAPSDLPQVVADQARTVGARDVVIYLIDYEQAALVPLPGGSVAGGPPLSVVGTVAGRAFSSTSMLRSQGDAPGLERLFVPLLDGTDRLGVIGMSFAEGTLSRSVVAGCERYAHLVAMLIVTKRAYGDAFEHIRRRRPMTLASELVWTLVPPLVFATDGLALAGMLEPCYDNGGDTLDYAVNDRVLHVGVFDAMGHGLPAAGVATFALSAYRHSRRSGRDLLETYVAMHEAVGSQFPDQRFVTAVIGQLDLDSGRLCWISAGHPPPLVIRGGRRAHLLKTTPVPPLGVDSPRGEPTVATEALEPGDLLLLYTDGLAEAREADGEMFTIERLSEFIEREAAAGQSAPETLRRLRHAVVGGGVELRDDATAVLLEWQGGREAALMPQTVL